MLYALTGEYIFGEAGTMCVKLRWAGNIQQNYKGNLINYKYKYNENYSFDKITSFYILLSLMVYFTIS